MIGAGSRPPTSRTEAPERRDRVTGFRIVERLLPGIEWALTRGGAAFSRKTQIPIGSLVTHCNVWDNQHGDSSTETLTMAQALLFPTVEERPSKKTKLHLPPTEVMT